MLKSTMTYIILGFAVLFLNSCSGENQQSQKSSSNTTELDDDEEEQAEIPTRVSGAFLTCSKEEQAETACRMEDEQGKMVEADNFSDMKLWDFYILEPTTGIEIPIPLDQLEVIPLPDNSEWQIKFKILDILEDQNIKIVFNETHEWIQEDQKENQED